MLNSLIIIVNIPDLSMIKRRDELWNETKIEGF